MAPVLTQAIDIAAILAGIDGEPGAGARRRRT
jgi:hypothetical protein